MPYDDNGNWFDDGSNFAVNTGGGAPTGGAPTGGAPTGGAPTSNLSVQTNTPVSTNTAPAGDLSVYPQYDENGNPTDTGIASGAASSFAIPENYGNPKNKIYNLTAAPDEKVRLVGTDGTVYYEGAGATGAKIVSDLVQQMGKEFGTGATWILQKQAPGSTDWRQVSQDTVGTTKKTQLNSFLDVALPTIAAMVAGPEWAVLAATGATAVNDALQNKNSSQALKDMAITAATTFAVGKIMPPGVSAASAKLVSDAASMTAARTLSTASAEALANGTAHAVANAATSAAVEAVIVEGIKRGTISAVEAAALRGSVNAIANTAVQNAVKATPTNTPTNGSGGNEVLQGGTGVDTLGGAAPAAGDVEQVVVTAAKKGVTLTPQEAAKLLANFGANWLSHVELPANSALDNTFNDFPDQTPLDNTYNDFPDQAPITKNPPLGPLAKIAAFAKGLTPLEIARLGLKGTEAALLLGNVLSGGGSGGGGGGSGAGPKTIAQQRAGLSPIFSAQLGAPKGMFSALGSAGTPYTPRPISNLVPDPVAPIGVAGGGAGGGLSGTALWADYLNRYPDVAKEAKANPGAYGDLNNDNVIDDTDFAIGHYAIAGQKDGHTLAAKTGGYIQGSSGTKNMYDPRFQVMRKADGGAVVTEPVPTTASSTADILRQLQGQPSRSLPVDPNLARSLAVDPRALAESYRSGATGGPSAMSVMQQPQSPYSGYEPGTMGGMYHYGEAPTGEKQFFNYAMAPGATPPWMANTPTGTGVYNMFGVKTGGVGAGGGGVGGVGTTGTTGTTDTTTTGTTTTPAATTTPVSAADMAKWSAYVNAYPDLAAAFAANNVAYGDFNHDGKVDIADFGLGQYTNYGQKEGRSLTGPASTAPANTPISAANRGLYSAYVTNTPDLAAAYAANPKAYGDFNNDGVIDIADFGLGQYTNYGKAEGRSLTGPAVPANTTIGGAPDTTVNAPTYKATDADAQKLMSSLSTFQDPTGFHYGDTDYAKLLLDQYRSGALDPASGTGQQLKGAGFKGGGAATRNDFSVQGPGTGRSDSIPAALSDGEYVMDAETVALLGDGSSKAGAKKLDAMRSNLRKAKGRNLVKGRFSVNAKAPEAYLSGGRT